MMINIIIGIICLDNSYLFIKYCSSTMYNERLAGKMQTSISNFENMLRTLFYNPCIRSHKAWNRLKKLTVDYLFHSCTHDVKPINDFYRQGKLKILNWCSTAFETSHQCIFKRKQKRENSVPSNI